MHLTSCITKNHTMPETKRDILRNCILLNFHFTLDVGLIIKIKKYSTWKPQYLIIIITISCTLFTIRHLCFKRIAAVKAILRYHSKIFFLLGVAMVTMIEYNSGVRSFNSWQMLVNNRFRMSLTFDFRNSDSCLDETMSLHSTDSCFNIHLASSDVSSFTRYAAEAISFHVPRRSAQPSGSSTGCSLCRFVWEGHETTI